MGRACCAWHFLSFPNRPKSCCVRLPLAFMEIVAMNCWMSVAPAAKTFSPPCAAHGKPQQHPPQKKEFASLTFDLEWCCRRKAAHCPRCCFLSRLDLAGKLAAVANTGVGLP